MLGSIKGRFFCIYPKFIYFLVELQVVDFLKLAILACSFGAFQKVQFFSHLGTLSQLIHIFHRAFCLFSELEKL